MTTLIHRPGKYDPPTIVQPIDYPAGDDNETTYVTAVSSYESDGSRVYLWGPPDVGIDWAGTDFYPPDLDPAALTYQRIGMRWYAASESRWRAWAAATITGGVAVVWDATNLDDPGGLWPPGEHLEYIDIPSGIGLTDSVEVAFYWPTGAAPLIRDWWVETVYGPEPEASFVRGGVRIHPRNDGHGPSQTRRTYPPTPARTFARIP